MIKYPNLRRREKLNASFIYLFASSVNELFKIIVYILFSNFVNSFCSDVWVYGLHLPIGDVVVGVGGGGGACL